MTLRTRRPTLWIQLYNTFKQNCSQKATHYQQSSPTFFPTDSTSSACLTPALSLIFFRIIYAVQNLPWPLHYKYHLAKTALSLYLPFPYSQYPPNLSRHKCSTSIPAQHPPSFLSLPTVLKHILSRQSHSHLKPPTHNSIAMYTEPSLSVMLHLQPCLASKPYIHLTTSLEGIEWKSIPVCAKRLNQNIWVLIFLTTLRGQKRTSAPTTVPNTTHMHTMQVEHESR